MTSGQIGATKTAAIEPQVQETSTQREFRHTGKFPQALTHPGVGPILSSVNKPDDSDVLDEEIKKLEDRVSTLLGVCKRLKDENGSLRLREQTLTETNAKLSEKNRLARTRIESIIGKLKAMDAQGASHRGNGDGRG